MDNVQLYNGDCLDVLKTLTPGSVDAVVTSPPYAEQRAGAYLGVPEAEYPWWMSQWFANVRHALKPDGSIIVNIREHIKRGQISDYVHKTRLVLRMFGWNEAEELIWSKTCSPPFGNVDRPRRAWERLLWFSKSNTPWCDTRGNGVESNRVGIDQRSEMPFYNGGKKVTKLAAGVARGTDVCTCAKDNTQVEHPAKYPVSLAEWCMRLVCPQGGTILDPFMGSGTTGVACVQTGRKFIGIEIDPSYFAIAEKRIAEAAANLECVGV